METAGKSKCATILIIDDDAGLLSLIQKALKREGFVTATALSGQEAIAWLSQNSADLMLLDLKLPDIEGKDLINRLAALGKATPFIVITGQGDERVAVDMMKRGALDYLIKDVQFVEFVPTVVKHALEQVDKDKRLANAERKAIQLQREILEISEREQRRIGHDLHDGLGQQLTALELMSQALIGKLKTTAPKLVKPAQEISRQIRETVTQTRLLSHNLSPVPLEAEGLMLALAELAAGISASSGIACEFICPQPVLLPEANTATHLYRIAQEAVNNAVKHSKARKINIMLTGLKGSWTMSVQDNGRGFAPIPDQDSGMGLRIMKYRSQLIGASLNVDSAPDKGVSITCSCQKHL
jgi:signal transduction histidine kinase